MMGLEHFWGGAKPRNITMRGDGQWSRAVARLHQRNFSIGWSTVDVQKLVEQPACTLLINRPVGTGAVRAEEAENGQLPINGFCLYRQSGVGEHAEAEILTIAVARECRRMGIGETLMRETILSLAGDRVGELFLEVNEDNAGAVHLYRKLGFATVGKRPGYYKDAVKAHKDSGAQKASAALVMRLDLVSTSAGG